MYYGLIILKRTGTCSMTKKIICFLLMLAFTYGACFSQTIRRTIYAIKGNDTLWFDRYVPSVPANGISVVFVHGGAFTGGDPENQRPMGEGLSKMGYNVFVLKYRLYLKGKSFGCETATPEKLKAIKIAVDDTYDAVRYIASISASIGIDTGKIFIAGSSAGAETILNLVYNPFLKGRKPTIEAKEKFLFAGAMSFAGALLDINENLFSKRVPLLLMHGTNDQLVPYSTAPHRFCSASDIGWLMMFGSGTIYNTLQQHGIPVVLYSFEGKGHEVSNYMFRRFREMDEFMKQVINGSNFASRHIRE